MVSLSMFSAIDKYASLYQNFVRVSVEWNIKRQLFFYVSEKNKLFVWYVNTIILFLDVLCYLTTSVSQVFLRKKYIPLWIVILQTTLGMIGGLNVCLAVILSLYSEDIVFAINSIIFLSKRIPKGENISNLHM